MYKFLHDPINIFKSRETTEPGNQEGSVLNLAPKSTYLLIQVPFEDPGWG